MSECRHRIALSLNLPWARRFIDAACLWGQVRTMLSQNTTDTTSHRAFQRLKDVFSDWESMRQAPAGSSLLNFLACHSSHGPHRCECSSCAAAVLQSGLRVHSKNCKAQGCSGVEQVEEAIKEAGLAKTRTARMQVCVHICCSDWYA